MIAGRPPRIFGEPLAAGVRIALTVSYHFTHSIIQSSCYSVGGIAALAFRMRFIVREPKRTGKPKKTR